MNSNNKNMVELLEGDPHWQALKLFNIYRIILAFTFLTIYIVNSRINIFTISDLSLFLKISVSYLTLSLVYLALSLYYQKHFNFQANFTIFTDLIVILLLMHLCGGILSGLAMLMIIIIAAHSLLVPGRLSYFSAAFATIVLMLELSYSVLKLDIQTRLFTQVGLLGIALFATALVTNLLALRATRNLGIVRAQAAKLATSQQLNAHVISAMHAGVIVLDQTQQIRLINTAAKMLLGIQSHQPLRHINDLPDLFQSEFRQWHERYRTSPSQNVNLKNPDIRLTFHPIGKELAVGTLVFIYNTLEETKYAQDLKISSLGHLTANIAHEMRNPLGAASHAAQLLAESQNLTQDDKRLIKMIKQSCDRMNKVIQNVLSLSHRKPAKFQQIDLVPWLEQFVKDMIIPDIPQPKIQLDIEMENTSIFVDPTQLTQILINLCENGLRYSLKKNKIPTLNLKVDASKDLNQIHINVIDQGEGVAPEVAKHIFEPFFTTENNGSGLGLYIAKELAQMNGAKLDLMPSHQGCHFKITIPLGDVL